MKIRIFTQPLSADGRYLAYIEETRDSGDSPTACRIVVRERQTARIASFTCPEPVAALPDPTPVFNADGRVLQWFHEPLSVNPIQDGLPARPATTVMLPNPLE